MCEQPGKCIYRTVIFTCEELEEEGQRKLWPQSGGETTSVLSNGTTTGRWHLCHPSLDQDLFRRFKTGTKPPKPTLTLERLPLWASTINTWEVWICWTHLQQITSMHWNPGGGTCASSGTQWPLLWSTPGSSTSSTAYALRMPKKEILNMRKFQAQLASSLIAVMIYLCYLPCSWKIRLVFQMYINWDICSLDSNLVDRTLKTPKRGRPFSANKSPETGALWMVERDHTWMMEVQRLPLLKSHANHRPWTCAWTKLDISPWRQREGSADVAVKGTPIPKAASVMSASVFQRTGTVSGITTIEKREHCRRCTVNNVNK